MKISRFYVYGFNHTGFCLSDNFMGKYYGIMQFGKFVKVIKPQSLQDTIKSDILEMQKLYEE